MPHIHTEPGQHDITVSAYIVRTDGEAPRCLVHMHKKRGLLMQVGGHVELEEDPWRALAHELEEESGYTIDELSVLQPTENRVALAYGTAHPVPILMNTHRVDVVQQGHFHSDMAYGFIVDHAPSKLPGDGESTDLRWLTLEELRAGVAAGTTLVTVAEIYDAVVNIYLPTYSAIKTKEFAL